MKWISIIAVLLGMQAQAANHVEISKDEIVIKFKSSLMSQYSLEALNNHENVGHFMSTLTGEDVDRARVISKSNDSLIAVVKVAPEMSLQATSEAMVKNNPNIEWAHPNRIYHGEYRESLNDPMLGQQHHLKQIKALQALAIQVGNPNVVIAVTDDGFDLDHEDLLTSWHVNPLENPNDGIDNDNNGYIDDHVGWDFNNNDNNPGDGNGYGSHGTHIAGIINATPNNNKGVIGVAPGIKIMPLKFYGSKRWTSAMVYETYAYAVNNGARIITTSYNINAMSRDPVYRNAVRYAHDNNVLVFNSAGNGNEQDPERSRLETLLLVSSVDASASSRKVDKRSSFSNYGYQIDISAPGGDIMATGMNDRYIGMSGTSMATPMAAAMAGMIMSQYPQLTIRQVLHTLLVSVDSINAKNPNYLFQLGSGRINALKGVDSTVEPLQIYVPEFQTTRNPIKSVDDNSIIIRFQGAPGSSFRPIKIVNRETKSVARSVRLQQAIYLGTNQIRYQFEKLTPGNYQLVIAEDSFYDPFARKLDGNFDGKPGGDLVLNFSVR
jgi:subtilisin family serine protease